MSSLKNFIAENPTRFERMISRVEIAGLVVTMAGVVMLTKKINGGNMLLIVGLSTLSFVYFLLANFGPAIFKLQPGKIFTIALQVSYGALALTMMGVLFILMGWPNGSLMLNIGCIITGAGFLFFNYKMYFGKLDDDAHRVIINNLVVRMFPALLAAAFLIAIYLKT